MSDTNRGSVHFGLEETWGATPGTGDNAPKMYPARMTGETLGHKKETVESEIIRADRMRDDFMEVGVSAEGDINLELVLKDWDLMLEIMMNATTSWIFSKTFNNVIASTASDNRFTASSGDFAEFRVGAEVWAEAAEGPKKNLGLFKITAVTATYITVANNTLGNHTYTGEITFRTNHLVLGDAVVATTSTITSAGFDLTTSALAQYQHVMLGGFAEAGNNGLILTVASVAAGTLTFIETTLTTESADADAYIIGKRLLNGILSKSALLEKHFEDVDDLVYFNGMAVSTFSLSASAKQIVTGSFSFMGKEGVTGTSTISGARTSAFATTPVNGSANMGTIKEGGSALSTALKSIEMEVSNNLRLTDKLGQKAPNAVGRGFFSVTGTITAYFEDLTLFNKAINHTSSSLEYQLTDVDGNVVYFEIPKIYFTGNPTIPSGNDDVIIPLEFTAVRDQTKNYMLAIDMLAA